MKGDSPHNDNAQHDNKAASEPTAATEGAVAATRATPQSVSLATKSSACKQAEYGGPTGLEPTRYGDWERDGRCFDF